MYQMLLQRGRRQAPPLHHRVGEHHIDGVGQRRGDDDGGGDQRVDVEAWHGLGHWLWLTGCGRKGVVKTRADSVRTGNILRGGALLHASTTRPSGAPQHEETILARLELCIILTLRRRGTRRLEG